VWERIEWDFASTGAPAATITVPGVGPELDVTTMPLFFRRAK
jgi:hypothetical protein